MRKYGKLTLFLMIAITLFGFGMALSVKEEVKADTIVKYIDFEISKADMVLEEIEKVGTQTKYRVVGFTDDFKNRVKSTITQKNEQGVEYLAHLIFPNVLTQSSNIQVISEFGDDGLTQYLSTTDIYSNGLSANVGKITFPTYLEKINSYSNYLLYNLRIVNFSASQVLTEIGQYAFQSCSRLYEINTYSGASKRLDTTFPYSLRTIGKNAFASNGKLTEVKFAREIDLGNYAFYNCQSLENIVFGNDDITFGENCFENDIALKSVTLPDNLEVIPTKAFNLCSGLEEVVFSKKLIKIGNSAFLNCYSLKTLNFDESTMFNEIGESAFENCYSLEEFTFTTTFRKLGLNAFKMTTSTTDAIEINDEAKLIKVIFAEGAFGLVKDEECLTEDDIAELNLTNLGDTFNSVKYFLYHNEYKNSFVGNSLKGIYCQLSNAYPNAQFRMYPIEIVYKYYNYAENEFVDETDNDVDDDTKWVVYNNTNLITNEVLPGQTLSEIYFPQMPTRLGYDFIGWHTVTNPVADSTKAEDGYVVPLDGIYNKITFYAVYKLKTFKLEIQALNYKSNNTVSDGEIIFEESVKYGDKKNYDDLTYSCLELNVLGLYANKSITEPIKELYFEQDIKIYALNFSENIYNYSLNSDNTYTLTGCKFSISNLIIPNTYNNLPVIAIKDNAFNGDKTISRLMPLTTNSNLKTIGAYAFANSSLVYAILPESCIELKQMAFGNLSSLILTMTNIEIELRTDAVPSNCVVCITKEDYNDSSKLATWRSKFPDVVDILMVNNKVVTIDIKEVNSILSGNDKLADSITVNVHPFCVFELPSLNKLGYEYVNCQVNASIEDDYTVKYDSLSNETNIVVYYEFIYDLEVSTDYLFEIKGIKDKFNNHEKLEIPTTYSYSKFAIKSIADNAFADNEVIKEIVLGDKIVRIGANAFKNSKIEKISFAKNSGLADLAPTNTTPFGFTIDENAFADSQLKTIDFTNLTTYKIVVKDGAFLNCSKLTSVDFSKIKLQIKTFENSDNVIIPLQNIDLNAFEESGLESIVLYSFGEITFPEYTNIPKLKTIEFADYTELTGIVKYIVHEGVVYTLDKKQLLFMPSGLDTHFVLPEETKTISIAFRYNTSLKSVTLNENVNHMYRVIDGVVYYKPHAEWMLYHMPAGLNVKELTVVGKIDNVDVGYISDYALRYNYYLKVLKFAGDFVPNYIYDNQLYPVLNNEMYGNFECIYLTTNISCICEDNFKNVPTLKTVVLDYPTNLQPTFIDKQITDNLKDYFGLNVTSVIVPENKLSSYKTQWSNDELLATNIVVSFQTNMGENLPDMSIELGSTPNLVNPTKKGYDFVGWYSDPEYTTAFNSSAMYSNTTLYAKFVLHKYNVTYMVEDKVYATEGVLFNSKAKGPESTPTKTGYIFDGWLDANGKKYDMSSKVESDLILKATFVRDKDYVTKQIIIYAAIGLAVIIVIVVTIVLIKKHREKQMLRNPNKVKEKKSKNK